MEQEEVVLKDDKKTRSTMRFMCVACLFISLGFGISSLCLAAKGLVIAAEYGFIFTCTFLGSAFGGKVVQKLLEVNPNFLNRTK